MKKGNLKKLRTFEVTVTKKQNGVSIGTFVEHACRVEAPKVGEGYRTLTENPISAKYISVREISE